MKKAYKNIKPEIETPKLSFETYRQVYNWPGICLYWLFALSSVFQ